MYMTKTTVALVVVIFVAWSTTVQTLSISLNPSVGKKGQSMPNVKSDSAWTQTLHDEFLSNRAPFNTAHPDWFFQFQPSSLIQSHASTISSYHLSSHFYRMAGLALDEVNNQVVISSSNYIQAMDIPTMKIKWSATLREASSYPSPVSGNLLTVQDGFGQTLLYVGTGLSIYKIASSDGSLLSIVHLNSPPDHSGEAGIGGMSLVKDDILAIVMNGGSSYSSYMYFVDVSNGYYQFSPVSSPSQNFNLYDCSAPTPMQVMEFSILQLYGHASFVCKNSFLPTYDSLMLIGMKSVLSYKDNSEMGPILTLPQPDFSELLTHRLVVDHVWIGAVNDQRSQVAVLNLESKVMNILNVEKKGSVDEVLSLSNVPWLLTENQCKLFTASNSKLYACCFNNSLKCQSFSYNH
ncbi:hypothetical protein C9374_007784 [Naegleria lovaniensis]|uniref:Uncharacterized protein n=1 Tax=Naegleria lovaniensis TaxID=51637 RepID=A0AA88GMJ3_NAELO|nr:uncharacterized protein C9374_007784 [Naegleria lovaniensis]KAG2379146.1 hypothetical protein C9374_007784 [Naegleria lovaniensis]